MQNRSKQIIWKNIKNIFSRNKVFYKGKWCLENKNKLKDATVRNIVCHWTFSFFKENLKHYIQSFFKKSIKNITQLNQEISKIMNSCSILKLVKVKSL